MSIVSSSFVVDTHNQIDGRIYVKETHVDSAGGEHIVEYLANVGMDHAAICADRAAQIARGDRCTRASRKAYRAQAPPLRHASFPNAARSRSGV